MVDVDMMVAKIGISQTKWMERTARPFTWE
jgi:hypothetical protein